MIKLTALVATALFCLSIPVFGEDQIALNVATNVEMANGYVYTNAIIKRVLPDSILVDSDVFAGSIPCENLAPKFQKYFDKQKK